MPAPTLSTAAADAISSSTHTIVVDALDPQAQARWWARVLDWTIVVDAPDDTVIIPKDVPPGPLDDLSSWMSAGQGMAFVRVPEEKSVKNRLHIDLAPHTSQDRDEEIARLLQLGAAHTDVGQTEADGWTVLRDPEGNEFCVLSSRDS